MATKSPNPFFHVTFAREIPIPDRTRVSDEIYVDFMHHVRDAARNQLPLWLDVDGVEIVGVEPNAKYARGDDGDDHELRVTAQADRGPVMNARIPVRFEFEYWNNAMSSGAVLVAQYALITDMRLALDTAGDFESARMAALSHRVGRTVALPGRRLEGRMQGWFR